MVGYVTSALYIYSEEGRAYVEEVCENPFDVRVTPLFYENIEGDKAAILTDCKHVVVCGPLAVIKKVMRWAMKYRFSLGFLALPTSLALSRCYGLPKNRPDQISLALRDDPRDLDIVLCNDQILLFKASIGRIPLVDNAENIGLVSMVLKGLREIASLHMLPFKVHTGKENSTQIATAVSGCLIFANPEKSFAAKLIAHDISFSDGMVSTVMVAPKSIFDYLRLMFTTLTGMGANAVSDSTGYIKSSALSIETEIALSIKIDGEDATATPLECRVLPAALKINHGKDLTIGEGQGKPSGEKNITGALPVGKELNKARNKRVPLFTYASEERFKDLFVALRQDASINSTYFVLMVLSTILATVGLYMNSASVIIGAMLLAPLMAPIISMAMSLLRRERAMLRQSFWKIVAGIFLALSTGAIMTLIFPYQPLTNEMQGRLHPTVLDLLVAISAGVAGAYTKSYKEILQSLAGVAIAVALVPPLATAGIGIGRFDLVFFSQAFLLFLTNLIGIILAAAFTFRVLGFSPVVKNKRGLLLVSVFFVLISIPLFIAYQSISEKTAFEKSWKFERFLVNGKYLIVQEADLKRIQKREVLTVEILARDQLNRNDFNEFERKVKKNFSDDLIIRAKMTYIP